MIDRNVWDDQAEFNDSLRAVPVARPDRIALTKEFALHMVSEIGELLDASGTWAIHRRRVDPEMNEENFRRQLIDIFKYWMSICQTWGFSPSDMEGTYWRKSATVRQRHAEEFIFQISKPIAILDLDNVLADYTAGFHTWLSQFRTWDERQGIYDPQRYPLTGEEVYARSAAVAARRGWYSAQTMDLDLASWNHLQRRFRGMRGFAHLPLMDHAVELVRQLRDVAGYDVIGLTSRPIDEYPNIYDDTLEWLMQHGIRLDCVWWGANKAEKLAAMLPHLANVALVVDDDVKYIRQYQEYGGIRRIYWFVSSEGTNNIDLGRDTRVVIAQSLTDIMRHATGEVLRGHQ